MVREGAGDEGREGAGMIELTKMVATQFLCPRATLYLGKEKQWGDTIHTACVISRSIS